MSEKNSQSRIVRTPHPPYYAVSTTTEFLSGYDKQAHIALATELYAHAQEIDGFLGLESFFEDNAAIAVSFWKTVDDIKKWRHHSAHQNAKAIAKEKWFGPTITRIAHVESDYGFNLEDAKKPNRIEAD